MCFFDIRKTKKTLSRFNLNPQVGRRVYKSCRRQVFRQSRERLVAARPTAVRTYDLQFNYALLHTLSFTLGVQPRTLGKQPQTTNKKTSFEV